MLGMISDLSAEDRRAISDFRRSPLGIAQNLLVLSFPKKGPAGFEQFVTAPSGIHNAPLGQVHVALHVSRSASLPGKFPLPRP